MRTPLLLMAALTAAVCAACGTADAPIAPTAPGSSVATSPAVPSSMLAGRPTAVLSVLKPCDMLTDAQVSLYGYTDEQSFDDGTTRTCTYTQRGSARQLVVSFADTSVRTLRHNQGDTVSSRRVGHHPAVVVQSTRSPMCSHFLDIEGVQFVLVQALGQTSSAEACTHSAAVATVIEPSLP